MAVPGDRIKIVTKEKEIEGILMPNESDSSVFIKRNDGYNMGIDKKKITKISVLKAKTEKKEQKKVIKDKKGLKKIVILHTGGTIASKVDYETGGVIAKFSAGDLIEMFPELIEIANFQTDLVSNMMSEDMVFSDYQKIISSIKKYIGKCDGIIIGHGTDTLAYTAAALSFAIENPSIPILLVGSQRSSDRGSSDAAQNLLCASLFITRSDFKGIAICMHNSSNDDKCAILPPTKTRKMHTSRRDAFKTINDSPIALVDSKSQKIEFIKELTDKATPDNKIIIKDKFETKVGLLKTHPNIDPNLFEFFTKNYKAIIIEGTGLGHAPTNLGNNNLKNYEILKRFIKSGGIVAITSQCLFGRVHPNVYTNLRRLSDIGCIFCEDMLPETAFIKLAWLLGNYDKEKAKELLNKNLREEITERTPYKEDFLEQFK
ncbi:MAG: Glu-tRNA(Gln) amidotransferase subunit GatD [Nanoarchaeota archaeon]|nr:Glu-tRNA(Gln) amidotransferase subunit GatD [Nanoarchaeota archaeon]